MNRVRSAALSAFALAASVCIAQHASAPQPAAMTQPAPHAALPRTRDLGKGVWIGGQPEGDAGFAELRRMGVRTVISVDGAPPDVETARRFGLRYVHLPIRYSAIEPRRQAELARAISTLPAPVYVHCHLGKHRGPAAAATALASLGRISAAEAEAILVAAGTSPKYAGLYATVRSARRLSDAELGAIDAAFPEIEQLSGMRAGMSRLDQLTTDLEHLRSSGWKSDAEHADLVPDRALRTTIELLSELRRHATEQPPEFLAELSGSADDLRAVGAALEPTLNLATANRAFDRFHARCTSCHDRFRE